jgi:peptide/nickel transport system ATP-binding protein
MPALVVRDLTTEFLTEAGPVRALDSVGFAIDAGETVALVGESGSGKSVTALSILDLIPHRTGRIVAGSVMLDGTELRRLDERQMQQLRGKHISMIFQEPMTSLNPLMAVGDQIGEVLRLHTDLSSRAVEARVLELLELVQIPDARQRARDYPHQFSGGMRQRVVIAIALACHPKVLIADEPTTALDVTVQAQILGLIRRLQRQLGIALLLITHDLRLVRTFADRVVVMYAGRKVEEAPVSTILNAPAHPYTKGLIGSVMDPRTAGKRARLQTIPGMVPSLSAMPSGCAFAPRCSFAEARCRNSKPTIEFVADGHVAACHVFARAAQ